jgi:hypothetical protein
MIRFWGFLQWSDQPDAPVTPVDLGNGCSVKAEDLLDSHFTNRIDAPRLTVHVEGDLNKALTALAPGLASLTELAEEVDQAVPRAQPTPQFRQDLQKALELTHKQHHAQRVLGTRVETPEAQIPWSMLSLVVLLVACTISLTLYLLKRRELQVY